MFAGWMVFKVQQSEKRLNKIWLMTTSKQLHKMYRYLIDEIPWSAFQAHMFGYPKPLCSYILDGQY